MKVSQVLLCTVGGSHKPIVKAIESAPGAYVCFFSTGKDPATGRPGSEIQILGKDNVIKENPGDDNPTLPNIPAQACLEAQDFENRPVPADDLEGAVNAMREAVVALRENFPEARFIADYTGGTKSMSAALVCVALESDEVDLQLVAGARSNLVSVRSESMPAMMGVAGLRLGRRIDEALGHWRHHSYRECEQFLDSLRIAVSHASFPRLARALDISRALASWDDFDHATAYGVLRDYGGLLAPDLDWILPVLSNLTRSGQRSQEPARLLDLWWNAERRARQGRYDDATGRWYRLMEWTAQWQLRSKLSVDTADVPPKMLPAESRESAGRSGRRSVGLRDAWKIVAERLDGPASEFAVRVEPELLDLLKVRNNSLLAHGFETVGETQWRRIQQFTEESFLPIFWLLAADAGLRSSSRIQPRQLPTSPPSCLGVART